jgi:hypothetical protein
MDPTTQIGTLMTVLQFPKKIDDLPSTAEEAKERLLEVRSRFALDISSSILDTVISEMINYGIKVRTDDIYQKDLVFLAESLNSILLRYVGAKHDFQDIAEKIVDLDDEDGETKEESDKE